MSDGSMPSHAFNIGGQMVAPCQVVPEPIFQEAEEGEEQVYGAAAELLVEWHEAWAEPRLARHTLNWLRAERRRLELELRLIGVFGVDPSPRRRALEWTTARAGATGARGPGRRMARHASRPRSAGAASRLKRGLLPDRSGVPPSRNALRMAYATQIMDHHPDVTRISGVRQCGPCVDTRPRPSSRAHDGWDGRPRSLG